MKSDLFWQVFVAAALADIVVRLVWSFAGY